MSCRSVSNVKRSVEGDDGVSLFEGLLPAGVQHKVQVMHVNPASGERQRRKRSDGRK